WVPTTDIYATKDGDLVIRCEIAGVTRDALDISFSNSVLTVSGERRERPEGVTYYAHERHYGHFRRNMTLPEGVQESDVNATFEDGMLEVLVKGGAAPREPSSIEIGTSEN
ncbi:MAG: Hsp20/alpha crystallin family protein, partial [Rubrobacteraceae bacterium]